VTKVIDRWADRLPQVISAKRVRNLGPDTLRSMDTCIFCKGATDPHCENVACTWQRCPACESVLWTSATRAVYRGRSVPWPYARPD
jgi:hypothetical protein